MPRIRTHCGLRQLRSAAPRNPSQPSPKHYAPWHPSPALSEADMDKNETSLHRIVSVGGGAGGLEPATRLADTLGRKGRAQITLIDRSRTHLWKPLLHEVAAGSMDVDQHTLDYLAQARWHHFRFRLGSMAGLDRERRVVQVAATHADEGRLLIGERESSYDTLVIAVGSGTNDFGTPGAQDHAISLDMPEQAGRFHNRL